ncbi:MAG TPA: glycosyltransferase [Mycobacteriales bacterium]|nr:glycosyltransferase [Mycobacteriales bacterium]
MPPEVTVCVSTRNRSQLLPRLVGCLERQTVGRERMEAVIVDNGSTDDTWDVLTRLASSASFDLRVYRNPPGKGPAAGRNRAWRDAKGTWCAFTDDDCSPTPKWLESVLEGVGDRAVVAAGAVGAAPEDRDLISTFTRWTFATEGIARWGATANFVARRDDLEKVGGFDETFLNVAGEDTDLLLRLLETGLEFEFLRDAIVHHDISQPGFIGMWRDQRRWVDIPAVFANHPHERQAMLYRGVFWKRSHPKTLLLIAGLAGAVFDRRAALLAIPWIHERTCHRAASESIADRVATLPGVLALDLQEVALMVRGSLRYRTLML